MDSAEYFHAWLSAFAFTQALEVPIYVVGLGRDRAGGPPGWPARVGLAFLASAVTHPCVWYVIPRIFYSPWFDGLADAWPALDERRYEVFFFVAEAFAVVVEARLLRACGLSRALLWALLANGTSAGLGFMARVLGWL